MRSRHLLLLIYLTALFCHWGTSDAQQNDTCLTRQMCTQAGDPTSNFLQCVGLPATDIGRDHLQNLKDTIDAALDVYSFMRSSLSQTPVLGLELGISVNPEAKAYQDEDLIKVWMEVKLKPLLSSISRGFLTCLSNKNFSCNTYQIMVEELSDHFSEMDLVRQRWIYMFFMYPFLSGERAGCVRPGESSEAWLIRNFGSFKAVARMRDFTALNMVFSGLEVLHLLSPEQKAELLLHPEVEGLENGTLSLVFHTLMTEVHPPMENSTWTTPGHPSPTYPLSYTPAYPPRPTSDDQYSPLTPSPQESRREVVNGFMEVFRPFGSFVREFVSLTHKKPLSEIRSTTLTQVVLNWTLAELAGNYRAQDDEPEDWMEDGLDIEDWYEHVVVPVLRRVLPPDQTHIPGSLKAVFHKVFYLNSDMDSMDNDTMPLDVCSITLEERSCGLTNAVEKVARVLHCVARSNLTMSEETIMHLVMELTGRLNSLVQKFSTANFSEVAHHFQEVFGQADSPALTQENLNDPDFIRLWFQIKLKPLLPSISPSLLSCLSTKNFTCSVYQALVEELSEHIKLMDQEDEQVYEMHGHMIYKQFLLPFLLNHNSSDPQCISSTNSSADWLIKNFGGFSAFAPLRDLYDLNGNFSALSALEVLSPKQTAEVVVLPLPGLPGKDVIINTVFDYLTELPEERRLPEFLYHLVRLSAEITMPCKSYKIIFERLYQALPSVPPEMEPVIWANIDNLMQTAPEGCGFDEQCPSTPFNDTRVCSGVNSYPLQPHLQMGNMTEVLCNFTLEQYACSELKDFTAEHLVSLLKCKMSGNASQSKETWKVLLTKLTSVLDAALDMFSNMSKPVIGPAVSQVLDVIGEIRVNRLTEDQLRDSVVIRKWFSGRLRAFLPSASGGFLHCLSTKNLSCDTYQQILREFSNQFDTMDQVRQELVVKYFIYPFLTKNSSDSGCVSNSNSSVDWLQKNLVRFSVLVSLRELLELNTDFSPSSALEVLSPKQTAELVVLPRPGLPGKDVIINTVFDYLTESPKERKLPEFLYHLARLSAVSPVGCSVYQTIFVRLYQAMPVLPQEMEPIIWASVYDLTESAPMDCALVPADQQCPVSSHNATRVCAGVDSSALQQLLDSGISTGHLCDFSIKHYACSQLKDLTTENLVTLLKCKLSENNTYSKETWKLFFTKASAVLDQALGLLSNQSKPVIGPAVSQALDVIGEIRVNRLTEDQLRDSVVIRKLFSGRLRAFLPSASGGFLHCLSTKNLSCDSYQAVVKEFGAQFDHMTPEQEQLVLKELVVTFLSPPTTHSGCVSGSNNSVDWLQKNLGPFSVLVSLRDLLKLNTDFSLLSALEVLSPKQTAELVVLPLPGLPGKDVIINKVFDYLTESPKERRLPEFLQQLVSLSKQENIPCASYKIIFPRLDQAVPTVTMEIESALTSSKTALLQTVQSGCIVYSGECNVTPVNETKVCAGVNSIALQGHLDNGQISGVLCDFSIDVYACGSLSVLTSDNLVSLLKCKLSGKTSHSAQIWKLFFSKASVVLDSALDLFSNTTLDPSSPAVSQALNAIGEVRLDSFSLASLRDQKIINLWFNTRLRPFLPAVSTDFLSCLSTKNFSCSTYQTIVQILSSHHSAMDQARQISVYTTFIEVFLSRNNTADPSCSSGTQNSGDWLLKNFRGFSAFASFKDMQRLLTTFSVMDALPQLTVRQLAEVSSSPGQLSSAADVTMLMNYVPIILFTDFFNYFSPAITGQEFPVTVRSAMLQQVFDRGNLSDPSVSDQEVLTWLHSRLRPLLINLSPLHVAPLFSLVAQRNCSVRQQLVEVLNATLPTLQDNTQRNIYSKIILSLQGSSPLRCYGANYNQSFYGFLESSFLSFGFPNLTTFLSLIPHSQMEQLVNSLLVSDLGHFLRRPNIVDDDTKLCQLYSIYAKTPQFLGTERIPESVRRPTLPCVWPQALSSSQRSEVNAWFDLRLKNYLPFLTKSLVTSAAVQTAPCLAFQKIISILGSYNYSAADFVARDVYRETIKTYLTSASAPKCYNASDPELNSTAWFADNIGVFITYLTLEDLNTFGSAQVVQMFTVNLVNIVLLNHTSLPQNLTDYYTSLVYLQDSNFNPLLLPLLFRCVAPWQAFSQLDAEQSIILLHNLTTLCRNLDPLVSSVLAGNMGDNINGNSIAALGSKSTGLTEGQITMAPASVLLDSLSILSTVIGWNQGQAMAIIQSLTMSGTLQINSSSTLIMLGSLVTGVPSETFSRISSTELLDVSQNPTFLTYMMTAPTIITQTFVTQLITVDSSPDRIIQNVPDSMATEIPRSLLQGFSQRSVEKLNRKTWKHEQAVLFFDTVALGLNNSDNVSSSVLQGFTCTRVSSMTRTKIKNLVKACRRKGNNRVVLRENQLTCMYNYIKVESDVTSYNLYPPDLLLYYDYSKVSQDTCRLYFSELGDADFSVFSDALSFKRKALVDNAKTCLSISGTVLSNDNLQVLGNMVCVLDGSYIQNSDQLILQKLQNCDDLSDGQVAAIETLLTSGNTQYGLPATWNRQTLDNLGILPLYLTSSFYKNFSKKVKSQFLQSFLKVFSQNGMSRQKKRRMKTAIRQSIINQSQSKRSTVSECTVGMITQVTISETTFPFNYETLTQFNCCLTAKTVNDNLDAITSKVDDQEYLQVVLTRLREAYSTYSTIPEAKVQVLGPSSRIATNDDINMWNITKIDTLSALMDSSNGNWDAAMAQAIISKYLRNSGNTLGSAELNSIGGPNLCSLDTSLLKTITQSSLSKANALMVTNCTIEKKRALFTIAEGAFQSSSALSATSYQLTQPYIGGANSAYIQRLSTSNINMDMATFTILDPTVIQTLNVSQVIGLLGSNLPELKSYENQSVVRTWISTRFQSDLDSLGLDLKGGKADPTTVGVGTIIVPSTTVGVAGGSGSTLAGGAATTASGGAISRQTFGLHRLLTTLAIAVLYILH